VLLIDCTNTALPTGTTIIGVIAVFVSTTFLLNLSPLFTLSHSSVSDSERAFWQEYLATMLLAGWNLSDFCGRIAGQLCSHWKIVLRGSVISAFIVIRCCYYCCCYY
jgi:hypothetical protein